MPTLDAAKSAKQILSLYWQANDFPVDPAIIAKKMGLRVIAMSLPDSVLGILLKREGKDPNIVLEAPVDNGSPVPMS